MVIESAALPRAYPVRPHWEGARYILEAILIAIVYAGQPGEPQVDGLK